jgi:hypothetical protein
MALGNKKASQNTSTNQAPVQRDYSHTFHGSSNNQNNSNVEFNPNPSKTQMFNNSFERNAPPPYSSASHNSSMSSFAKKGADFDFQREE